MFYNSNLVIKMTVILGGWAAGTVCATAKKQEKDSDAGRRGAYLLTQVKGGGQEKTPSPQRRKKYLGVPYNTEMHVGTWERATLIS